jgi:ligand-binding sensor protein
LNTWLRIILCRRLRDGNPCLQHQSQDLKHDGEDDVLEDIKSINIRNWKKVAQNRDGLKKVVEQARTLYWL